VLAEGLVWKNIRDDKTAIELFQRELTGWPSNIAWLLKVFPIDNNEYERTGRF
jgi:hypothetical protein